MKRTLLLLGMLIWALGAGISSGTEIEMTKSRNPFDFGKGGAYFGGGSEGKGISATKPVSRLGMVYIIGDKKVAIIDGNTFHEGDSIEGSTITSITLEYVELASAYNTWRMYVEIPDE